MPELSGLPLEYERDYGTAVRYLNVLDFVDDSASESVVDIFRLSLPEQLFDFGSAKFRAVSDDRADALLVVQNSV